MTPKPMGALLASLIAAVCVAGLQAASPAPGSALAPAPDSVASSGPTGAPSRTRMIVDAADAFLATLTVEQKKALQFAFTDAAQRQRWSNFPDGHVQRAGVRWGVMNERQRAALMNLLGTVLGPKGVKMMREQMEAEEIVKAQPMPPERGARFGNEWYYVAFLGTPSENSPWMLQFTGHHVGLNATIVGPRLTISPSLTGGQPLKFISKEGKPVYIVADETLAALALLNSLTAEQRRKAIISSQRIDLVLGPGQDGRTLQPEGVRASELDESQRARLLDVIQARLGILNADTYATTMVPIRENLNATYFAWYGPVGEPGTAYFRVTGPTVLLEFSPQEPGIRFPNAPVTQHAHNMYRDPTNEYGSAWTSLR